MSAPYPYAFGAPYAYAGPVTRARSAPRRSARIGTSKSLPGAPWGITKTGRVRTKPTKKQGGAPSRPLTAWQRFFGDFARANRGRYVNAPRGAMARDASAAYKAQGGVVMGRRPRSPRAYPGYQVPFGGYGF